MSDIFIPPTSLTHDKVRRCVHELPLPRREKPTRALKCKSPTGASSAPLACAPQIWPSVILTSEKRATVAAAAAAVAGTGGCGDAVDSPDVCLVSNHASAALRLHSRLCPLACRHGTYIASRQLGPPRRQHLQHNCRGNDSGVYRARCPAMSPDTEQLLLLLAPLLRLLRLIRPCRLLMAQASILLPL